VILGVKVYQGWHINLRNWVEHYLEKGWSYNLRNDNGASTDFSEKKSLSSLRKAIIVLVSSVARLAYQQSFKFKVCSLKIVSIYSLLLTFNL
jgi:hypothetical protein